MFPLDELCFPLISLNYDYFFFQGHLIFSNNVHDCVCVYYVQFFGQNKQTTPESYYHYILHTVHTIIINIVSKEFVSDIY